MRVNFRELLATSKASSWKNTPIIFMSKGYAFPAAEMYSNYVSKASGLSVTYRGSFSEPLDDNSLFLYGSVEASELPTLLEYLHKPSEGIQVFAVNMDSKQKTPNITKLTGVATVVDVEEPTAKSLTDDIAYACQLLGIPYDGEGIKTLSLSCDLTWGSIQTVIMTQAAVYLEIKGNTAPVVTPYFSSGTYDAFKDKLIFGANWETSILIQESGNSCIEYTTRILNDLAMYHTILVYDEDGQKTSDIASTFGINEWFLRTRLLPRLRVLKRARLLLIMDKISDAQKQVLEESGTINKELFLAATVLSCLG